MAVDAVAPAGQLNQPDPRYGDTDEGSAEYPNEAAAHEGVVEHPDNDLNGSGSVAADRSRSRMRMSVMRLATLVGLVVVVALGGLAGWLGFHAYEAHKAQQKRELFLAVGRQGALNLTTIDWQHADDDVHRILDSATGTFYDDFSKRSQPFVAVVKQAQSKSVGTIAEAGLESVSGNAAQVLVAVTVKTSTADGPQQDPHGWRMRLSVQMVGNEAKISNVEFVP